jgi:hypothetical protein
MLPAAGDSEQRRRLKTHSLLTWLLYLSFLLKNEGKKENVKWSTLKCLLSAT